MFEDNSFAVVFFLSFFFFSVSVDLRCWDSAVSHTFRGVAHLELKPVAQWHVGIVQ